MTQAQLETRQEIVLMTVRMVASAFHGEMTAQEFNDKICEAGLHRELFSHADPVGDEETGDAFGVLTDIFDGELYDAIDAVLSAPEP